MTTKYLLVPSSPLTACNLSDDTVWSLSSGGANDTTAPTSGDDVIIDGLSSTTLYIDKDATINSLTLNLISLTKEIIIVPEQSLTINGTLNVTGVGSVHQIIAGGEVGGMAAHTIVPLMTSDTTPRGTCFTSRPSGSFYAFDRNNTSYWVSSGLPVYPCTLGYQFVHSQIITSYSITVRIAAAFLRGAPKDFTFEGSNDGSNWAILDTQAGLTWSSGETKTFSFSNSNYYSYYRLNISNGETPARCAIVSLQMFTPATYYNYGYLNVLGSSNIQYVDATSVDSSGGITITNTGGSITNTVNWVLAGISYPLPYTVRP